MLAYEPEPIKIRHIIAAIIATPIIYAVLWFYCAIGSAWEADIRCNNGYKPACITQTK